MSVKIRLTRLGDKKSPFYRMVVTDSRNARNGKCIENLGTYNPLKTEAEIKIDLEKTQKWISCGATPTETAKSVLTKAGITFKPSKAKVSVPKPKKEKKEENK